MKTMMKLLPLSIAAAVVAPSAMADFSANIAATSDYVFRGISLSDGAAISGGIDYEHESGLYAGTWVSNVDGGNETDFYVGFAGDAGDFNYGVGYIYYHYSQAKDLDYGEITADVSWKFLSAGVAYTVHDDVNSAGSKTAGYVEGDLYYYVGASYDLGQDWGVGATYGYTDFDNDGTVNGVKNDISYGYWQVDVTKAVGDFGEFTMSMIEADEESGDDDRKFVVSWSKSF